MTFNIETIETSGFATAMMALRLPYNKDSHSFIATDSSCEDADRGKVFSASLGIIFDQKDVDLAQKLIIRGDEHAKPLRGILAYAMIEAPIDFWVELETYEAGHQRLFSASTMHTEGKGLSGHALRKVIHEIPYDRIVTKADYFSYQTLRRIVYQRYNHRKECWHLFIEWIKTLPMANEFILVGLDDKIAYHDEWMAKYNSGEI